VIRLSKKVLCLDWDKRSVRLVVARTGANMVLEDAHAHRLPNTVDADDPASLGAFIAQLVKRHHLPHRSVVLDVSRDRVVINRITIPPTPAGEVAAALRFQAERELPFPLNEAEIDYLLLARDDSDRVTEVLLAAVRRATLATIRATCDAAGLTPARIGLRPYANVVSVSKLPGMLDQRVLFLDVGPTMTEIDVVRDRRLLFSRAASVTVPFFGGEFVSDDSMISSKAEIEENLRADAAESGAVEELLVEVTRTLQAYRVSEPNAPIDQIVVAGATGVEHALVDALDQRFGLPTTLFDPTPTLGLPDHESTKLRAFAATLGLAWGLGNEGALEIDFLNPKKPVDKKAETRKRARVITLAATTVLIAGVSYVAADLIKLTRNRDALVEANSDLAKEVKDLRLTDVRVAEVDDWVDEARMQVWLDHLLNLVQEMTQPGEYEPGKQLLISGMTCTFERGQISMNLLSSTPQVATDFVKTLNDFRYDGRPVYRAEQGTAQVTNTIDPKFTVSTSVTVDLLEFQAFREAQKKRELDRKRMLTP